MAKRQKLVWDTGMVAHLWANRSQESARNPRANLFFENETLYSYGYHFAVGEHVISKRGESAVLITTRTRSVTTAGHINLAIGSSRHLKQFHVDNVEAGHEDCRKEQFADYKERFTELGRRYVKARQNKPRILKEMEHLVAEANDFAKFFGLRSRLKMPVDANKWQEECKAINAKEASRRKEQEAKRELYLQEHQGKEAERLARWIAGDDCYQYGFGWGTPIALRIKGNTVETSRGAEVPLDHAIEVFRIARSCRNHEMPYSFNGHTIHVGQFALDSVDSQGNIKVGCHYIDWKELERVAKLAGIAGLPENPLLLL